MTRSSSTATKRRGVVLAAAVGVLTLGATAAASAAGRSHTVPTLAAKGPKTCVIMTGKSVPAAKALELDRAVQDAEAIKAGEKARTDKLSDVSVVERAGKPSRAWKCPGPILSSRPAKPGKPGQPGEPGVPGKWCRVLVVKGSGTAWKKAPVTDCDATLAPATPKKR